MRLKLLASLAVVCPLISWNSAAAQTLHLISIAASQDATIGLGTAANAKSIKNYASLVSVVAKLTLNVVEVSGAAFSCPKINEVVKELQANPQDAIIFYYSGHGLPSEAGKSIFPSLYCAETGPYPHLEDISKVLAAKGARFTLTVADACNKSLPDAPQFPQAKGLIDNSLRSLFLDYKGHILISSSSREEFSWYYDTGGLFTSRFIDILRNPPDTAPAQLWGAVISKATEKIMVANTPGGDTLQQPQARTTDLAFLGDK